MAQVVFAQALESIDQPVIEAALERPGLPIRLRIQPTILRVTDVTKGPESRADHRSWKGLSWLVSCDTVEEASAVRKVLEVFFQQVGTYGPVRTTLALETAGVPIGLPTGETEAVDEQLV